ncbi:MAG: thioredoxin [Eubacteriales bacterium]|nr:thioredoxin [Eubacteriales bacterium]MDD4390416.1 thioredoxin [Eubacteriales bacterium]
MVLQLTKENFESEVIKSEVPVLVDFWASWCGPCKMVGPVIDKIGEEAVGFKVGKVNVDEQPELAGEYSVMSVPTLIVIKDGKVANKAIGAISKESILALLK